jgi:D-alanyl-D-alanine-carboxypeptidase/D-alanyl-D-alanine-endopeptidase
MDVEYTFRATTHNKGTPMLHRITVMAPLLLASRIAFAQDALPPAATIDTIIRARVDAGWAPGIVVGVVRADGSHQVVAYGSGGTGHPLNGESVFEIGSITKAFTGILLAEMAARGEVRLDEPVVALLPPGTRIPERNGKVITLLDLSTQSSGLPRLANNMPFADPANPYADYSDSLLFAFLASYNLTRDIGAQYEYSNLGVGLLGNALARRAGKPYEALLSERILLPLKLSDTRITLTPELRARVVQGHSTDGAPAGMWDLTSLAGAGAIRSTANDMLTFLAANISGAPGTLGQALVAAREPRRPAGSPVLKIGLGWHILTKSGHTIVWHNGGTGGYRSFAGYDPDRKIGVVVLTNSTNDSDDIGFHLLDSTSAVDSIRSAKPVSVPDSVLPEYVGDYELAPGFSIVVTREETRLYGQATGQDRFQMFPRGGDEFILRVVAARIVFQRDAAGRVIGMVLYQGGREIPGRKASPPTPSP